MYRNRLVELIVLGIGLDSGVLNQRLYVMMVIMALVTTFMTTPLVMRFSPPEYREQIRNRNKATMVESVPTTEPKESAPTMPEPVFLEENRLNPSGLEQQPQLQRYDRGPAGPSSM